MSETKRIQRKRTTGWRMPEGAVYVGRPTRWGNPYSIAMMQARIDELVAAGIGEVDSLSARDFAVEAFRADLTYGPDSPWWWYGPHNQIVAIKCALQDGALAGHDLACWCPLDQPCHADVLLKIANCGTTR
jgi:hypothetical protein